MLWDLISVNKWIIFSILEKFSEKGSIWQRYFNLPFEMDSKKQL